MTKFAWIRRIAVCGLTLAGMAVMSCSGEKPEAVGVTEKKEMMTKEVAKAEPAPAAVEAVAAGEKIYLQKCKICHGLGGKGDIGPSLKDDTWKYGKADNDIYYSIAKGRPGGMPNWENSLGEQKIRDVMAYLRTLQKR